MTANVKIVIIMELMIARVTFMVLQCCTAFRLMKHP
jgi:hypothetical protein